MKRLGTRYFQRTNKKFGKIFGQLLLAFIGIIIIPLFVLGISYAGYSKNYMEKDFVEKQEMKCDNMVKTINYWNTQVGIDMIRLSDNQVFQQYKRMTRPGVNLQQTFDIVSLFKDLSVKYDFFKSIYFYDETTSVVFSSLSGGYAFDEFHDTNWVDLLRPQFEVQLIPLRWDTDVNGTNTVMYSPEYVLSWVSSGYSGKYLIANISCVRFSKILSDTVVFSDSFVVSDPEGRIVFSDRPERIGQMIPSNYSGYTADHTEVEDHSYIVTRPVSDQLTAYLIVENAPLALTTHYMYTFIYMVCLLLVLIFTCVAFFIARKIYSPIDEIMTQLSVISSDEITALDSNRIKDELQVFHQAMDTLDSQKNRLLSMMSSYELIVRNSAFSDYINGRISCPYFLEQLDLLHLFHEGFQFQIFLFTPRRNLIPVSQSGDTMFLDLDLELTSLSYGLAFQADKDRYLSILFYSGQEDPKAQEEEFYSLLNPGILSHFYIATCEGATNYDVLPFVYKKALFALNHAIYYSLPPAFIHYEEILAPELTDYQLPSSYARNLNQAVMEGNEDQLHQTLDDLFHLLSVTQTNYKKCHNLLLQLLLTLKKSLSLEEANLVEQFHDLSTLAAARLFFLRYLTDQLLPHRKSDNSPGALCQSIKNYISIHYKENLNLVNLSSVFQLSYPYLSKTFKEQEKVTLIDYLNIVRIEKAKELLVSTSLNLPAIAEETGYNNPQSFQRFFKKLEGVTPGIYRQYHQNQMQP